MLNSNGYHCSDIQVLQDIIDINSQWISNNNPLELGSQEWNEEGRLTYLHISGYNQGTLYYLPNSFGALSNLEVLHLPAQYIASLPTSIGNLFNLEHLGLGQGSLTSLPESICLLPDDCYIYLNGNHICQESNYECIDISDGQNDYQVCCEGVNDEGEIVPNWTICP